MTLFFDFSIQIHIVFTPALGVDAGLFWFGLVLVLVFRLLN
jgi:hypothetical protein